MDSRSSRGRAFDTGFDEAGPGADDWRRAGLDSVGFEQADFGRPDLDGPGRRTARPGGTAPGSADSDHAGDAAAGNSRVSWPELDGTGESAPGRDGSRGDEPGANGRARGESGSGSPGTQPGAAPGSTASGRHIARHGFPVGRPRIVRRAGPVPQPAPAGDDEDDDRYVPPLPEPLPQLDPVAKGAWAALLGGPGYLLVATVIGWHVSDWAALAAIIAFVAGFAVLALRLSDKPRDDDDDGAVV